MNESKWGKRLSSILAADVVGYTRLMEQDTDGTVAYWQAARVNIIDPTIAEHSGRIVKHTGDGFLAEFPTIQAAVTCAVAMQEGLRASPLDFRMGVNLGDIIDDGEDIHGEGVNIAARIEALANPGGICISGGVFEQVRNQLDYHFEDSGEHVVKHVSAPVRIWHWSPTTSLAATPHNNISEEHHEANLMLSDAPSIAVLPFENMSDDPAQDYFADGITEDIITDLSKLSNLRVTARNSSFFYKNAQMTVQQIATKLNVLYVLRGSIRKSGENVRITAQLVDGRGDDHVWAERYDRRLSGIFELQDEITSSIVKALTVNISPLEKQVFEKSATRDVDAYENHLRARALLRKMTYRGVELAQQMFGKAILQDPNYALAYCGLADCASTLAYHYNTEKQVVDEAIKWSMKALEIDPALAEAHSAYGQALEMKGDHQGAEREYRAAIKLVPNSYQAYFYLGDLYLTNDHADRAHPLILKAYELNDHDLQAAMMLASAYRAVGKAKDLAKIARHIVDISEHRLNINPEDERAAYVGAMALIDLGDHKRATQWADLAASVAVEDSRASYNIACLYGMLGDVEKAFVHLEKTLKLGCSANKRAWMQIDPDLESVRLDQRFAKLLAQYH
jgi:adenylate cyclase